MPAHDVLVVCFAAAEAEPVAPRIHRTEGRGCLSHDRRMPPERRCGHPRAEVAARRLPRGAEHIPYELRGAGPRGTDLRRADLRVIESGHASIVAWRTSVAHPCAACV